VGCSSICVQVSGDTLLEVDGSPLLLSLTTLLAAKVETFISMDKDLLTAWIVIIAVLVIIFCIYCTLGSLAKKRGRSYWGWTIISFSIPLISALFFLQIEGTPILVIFVPFLIVYIISLLAVLLSGKTDEQKKKELWEAEEIRHMVERKYANTTSVTPNKTE